MLKVLELFGGIGACSKALERLGVEFEITDYVEIDKYAVKSFNAIHNTNFEPQDICEWNKDLDVDLIMHGSPCQDFSLSGKQAGGDEGSGTRSSLMYETIRIVEKLKPKYIIWENVKNIISKKHKHNYDNYCNKMGELGYRNYAKVLNAKDYGIPQNRERVFTISIRKDIDKEFVFPEKQELKLKLKDMLEDNVDEKYYLSDEMENYIYKNIRYDYENYIEYKRYNNQFEQNCRVWKNQCPSLHTMSNQVKIFIKNANSKGYLETTDGDGIDLAQPNSKTRRGRVQKESIQTLTTQNNLGVCVIGNYMPSGHEASRIIDSEGIAPTFKENYGTINATQTNDLRIRKLIPLETWRLMGFDDEDFYKAEQVNSNAQLYKQAGNSIVVNVLEAILKNLLLEDNNEIKGQISIFDLMEDQ